MIADGLDFDCSPLMLSGGISAGGFGPVVAVGVVGNDDELRIKYKCPVSESLAN